MGSTVRSVWTDAVGADPTRPLLTWYDDATGERVELSGATLDNWVSKTANLLVDGCGLGPGDRALVTLPPHWQSAAVLLGCWSAGLTVVTSGSADVAFTATPEGDAADRYILGFAPMGLPMRQVPDGWLDYVAQVRGFGDRFTGAPVAPGDPATDDADHATLVAAAAARAETLGIAPRGRALIDIATDPPPVDWLLAPLAVGTTVVLCAHLDPTTLPTRIAAEKVDSVLA